LEALVCRFCGHTFEPEDIQVGIQWAKKEFERRHTLTPEQKEKVSRGLCPNCDAYQAFKRDTSKNRLTCEVCRSDYPLDEEKRAQTEPEEPAAVQDPNKKDFAGKNVLIVTAIFLGLIVLGSLFSSSGEQRQQKQQKSTLAAAVKRYTPKRPATAAVAADTLATSGLWYGPVLRAHFPKAIPIHGWNYPIGKIPCLPKDITKFNVTAGTTTLYGLRAFQIRGTVRFDSLLPPFEVIDGTQGKRYMVHLQGYLFSPDGRLVWQQQGFPKRNSWVRASGDSARFILINGYSGSTSKHELIVVAAGDPIFSSNPETRVILGAKRIILP
jgi:hypothetical protein